MFRRQKDPAMTTSNVFDAIALRLGHLGCHEPAASPTAAISVQVSTLGDARLVSQDDAFCDDPHAILAVLEDLESGCGTDAVWEALRGGDDEDEDDGQPTDLEEQADFAQDDDWREWEVENFDPFDGE